MAETTTPNAGAAPGASRLGRLPGSFQALGNRALEFFDYVGGVSVLFSQTIAWIFVPPLKWSQIAIQMFRIGVQSLPVVALISVFIGMVLAFQSAYQMQRFSAEIYIASLVALSIVREIGPVITALIVAGRVGASIAAELGTMKVTEQIDALETLAANPVRYLVVPRFIATVVMLFILTCYADLIGIMGGFLVGVLKLDISPRLYWRMTVEPLHAKDVMTGLLKSLSFAIIICVISCYEGFRTEGGAEGVGRSTTLAVVTSFIMIIAADCLFTALFYFT
ncbi:MAG: ABC transporter permease [Candidatus Omnitrophica bacterium]|nr:ABC transporter permease [Candidatus Omnitrophota bacterium]